MKCRELAEFLMDYVGDELPATVRAEFEVHLSRCHNCHEYLTQYQDTIKAGKIACGEDHTLLEDVPEDLVKAILAARAAGKRG
jgi:anti-sigma factor RsiW